MNSAGVYLTYFVYFTAKASKCRGEAKTSAIVTLFLHTRNRIRNRISLLPRSHKIH